MKATLEFTLPEEREDFEMATNGVQLWLFMDEFYRKYRDLWKYQELTKDQLKIVDDFKAHMDEFKVEIAVR